MNKLIQKKNALPKLIDAQSGFLASQSAQVMKVKSEHGHVKPNHVISGFHLFFRSRGGKISTKGNRTSKAHFLSP